MITAHWSLLTRWVPLPASCRFASAYARLRLPPARPPKPPASLALPGGLEPTDQVPVTTPRPADWLIEAHGSPAFVKIDVEGMEHEVLAGLSVPLPAPSF
jgi:FkbM family methyltransferase